MSNAPIAIASDHAGYALKEQLKPFLVMLGYTALDLGTHSEESVDYPDFGAAVAESILSDKAEYGIVICGSGIGISIAANRHPGIRAALCHEGLSAQLARQHNNANVLALGSRLIGIEAAKECVTRFLNTDFAGGRHEARVA
jgi:ribose 5-phosphate isomerase B